MPLIELAIKRPIAVLSIVLMIVMMGFVALQLIPIQLTPDLRKPVVSIYTSWPGASPTEVEREITTRQEDALTGLDGLEEISSKSRDGRASIRLEFSIETNMDKALMLIGNALTNISGIPDEAKQPRIRTRDSEDNPIAWFVINKLPGNQRDIQTYGAFLEDFLADRLERIPGIALANIYGGKRQEIQVIVDPQKLAQFGLTIPNVISALRNANASVSAGVVEEGKRRYIVRTDNELINEDRIKNLIIRTQVDQSSGRIARVRISDIANVDFNFKKATTYILSDGAKAIVANVVRDTGVNVIKVMRDVRAAVKELNEGSLKQAGLSLRQVHDDTIYINSAISLVQQNIVVGGILAALILLLFLRSVRATVIISLAIPVSIIGSFVAMAALGRSINVISLAGIAFAVGMVVDAAIVVLENIFRLRQQGQPPFQAALNGAKQVWGAVFVSALTTVMVFVPILVMNLEVGQLFRDIAVAISVAVLLSLIISITVIPTLSNRMLSGPIKNISDAIKLPGIDHFAALFNRIILTYVHRVIASKKFSIATILIVCGFTATATWAFLPKLEYLPEGNRNLIIARIATPPGYSLDAVRKIAANTFERLKPNLAKVHGSKVEASDANGPVKMSRFWFVIRRGFTIAAGAAVDPARAKELIPIIRRAIFQEPGSRGFVFQTSLFGRGFGGGRNINLDISGPNLNEVLEVAGRANQMASRIFPRSNGNQIRANPGLQNASPEIRLTPDPRALSDNGMTAKELGQTIDAFNDGLRVAEVTVGGNRMDLTLMGPDKHVKKTESIGNLPVVTRTGLVLPVGSLANIMVTSSPDQIRHLERIKTITIGIRPSRDVPLEDAMALVTNSIMAKMRADGLPPGVSLKMGGTADSLTKTFDSMVLNLLLALVIVYLVMAILFESFVYPFIIMFSVPLATAGGVAGLTILNAFRFQALDMLTLLGFVILIGIVVNNAILLVHQTLVHVREEGMVAADAIMEATRNRIRPIFMSTLTSVFGMLPLAIFPGAGSELYSGLGSVVIGGLSLSAILTLLIIPPLLSLFSFSLKPNVIKAPSHMITLPTE
ncbi:MAG: efflux RND transporter permease subunit [Rhodospirillales bacterium]|jgi:HAE1 family hydrophobic/amphiphilic exporter-1